MDIIDLPIRIKFAGKSESGHRHCSPGTRKEDTLIGLFTNGAGMMYRGYMSHNIPVPCLGIFLPENPVFLLADRYRPYSYRYCRFSGIYGKEICKEILNTCDEGFIPLEHPADFSSFFDEIGHVTTPEQSRFLTEKELVLLKLLGKIHRVYFPKNDETKSDRKRLIGDYAHEYISYPIDLNHFAGHLNLTKAYLCRWTRKHMDRTPREILLEAKLSRARQLLKQTALPLKEIASSIGFEDPLYFSRIFKSNEGVSPITYRNDDS